MPNFKYIAKNKSGQSVNGNIEADSKEAVINMLRKQELLIISVQEQAIVKKSFFSENKKIKLDDIVIFSRQFATMVDSGIPLVQTLDILSEQIEHKTFSKKIASMRDELEGGLSLSDALNQHPDIFSPLYINMVKAGEAGGLLDEILDRLAVYLEKSSAIQKKVKSSMVYPILVTVMAFGITLFLLLKIVPTFKGIFLSLGGTLPGPTQLLVNISDWLGANFLYLTIGVTIVVIGFKRYIKTPKGRYKFDKFLLKIPLFGPLIKKTIIAQFSRTLSTLVKSGVPILTSLEIVAKTTNNKVVEEALEQVKISVREGENMAGPLARSGVFDSMVVRMVGVGEQTGQLEKMLGKIADFYEEQVDAAISGLSSMIEPLIISFLGIVIGGIVVAMFLPIFKITELIH